MPPKVSIIVLTYKHPEVFSRLFNSLPLTTGVEYEVVCVDNGSGPPSVEVLQHFKAEGKITTLVLEPINHFFSEGNNIGFRNCHPESRYVLILNSDIEIIRGDWLLRLVEWIEGRPELLPYTWSDHAVIPPRQARDIVSIGWSYDEQIPGKARPEGWCCLIRRPFYTGMSPDFPFYYGFEEMVAKAMCNGAKAGVLCQYSKYLHHFEGGSETRLIADQIHNRRQPDLAAWFANAAASETLDFTLGPHEHSSYIEW